MTSAASSISSALRILLIEASFIDLTLIDSLRDSYLRVSVTIEKPRQHFAGLSAPLGSSFSTTWAPYCLFYGRGKDVRPRTP